MRMRDRLRVIAWLIRDTFRQAHESRVFWLMLGLNGLVILLCLSLSVEGGATLQRPGERPDFLPRNATSGERSKAARDGVDIPSGTLKLAFGAFRVPLERDAEDAVRFIQLVLAGTAADTAGLLLALVWTAGFLPAFLAPRAVTVLLTKPVPRSVLLIGKYCGVVAFVAFQAALFFLGTWLTLGLRTGVWNAAYLWGLPLALVQFAVFYSVSTLIAATRRRTVTCLFGTLLVWLLCWCMNYGRHATVALPELSRDVVKPSPWLRATVEAGYWVLPKPADLSILLHRALEPDAFATAVPEFAIVQRTGRFYPALSVTTSLLAAAALLTIACRRFAAADY